MFQLIKKISISVLFFLIFILPIQSLAVTKPIKMNVSKNKLELVVGKEITIRSKYRAAIRVNFFPEDAKADIVVKVNNKDLVQLKKVDKYFYKLKAIKKGKAKLSIYSKINPKLKKNLVIEVIDKKRKSNKKDSSLEEEGFNEKESKEEAKQIFESIDVCFAQEEPDWKCSIQPGIRGMGLNTRGLKVYLKLKDRDEKIIESDRNYDFFYKSSDETILKMSSNRIIPVKMGKADIIAVYKYKGKEYEFIPATITINDYARPVSILFNSTSTVVPSYGEDDRIRIKAVYDQYGNEMNLSEAEWKFLCFDYDINPSAELSGSRVYIKGNDAHPGTYKMNVAVTIFGVSASTVLEILVR